MTKVAFSHLAEAEGRRLKDIQLLAKYQSRSRMLNKPFLIKPCENLNDQQNHFFNPHGPQQEIKKFNPSSKWGGVIKDSKSDY
jgi:hypothetical protein